MKKGICWQIRQNLKEIAQLMKAQISTEEFLQHLYPIFGALCIAFWLNLGNFLALSVTLFQTVCIFIPH